MERACECEKERAEEKLSLYDDYSILHGYYCPKLHVGHVCIHILSTERENYHVGKFYRNGNFKKGFS